MLEILETILKILELLKKDNQVVSNDVEELDKLFDKFPAYKKFIKEGQKDFARRLKNYGN